MKTPLTVSNKWFLAENVVTVLKANFLSQYMILMILKELNCNEIKRNTKFCRVSPMPVGNGMEFIIIIIIIIIIIFIFIIILFFFYYFVALE